MKKREKKREERNGWEIIKITWILLFVVFGVECCEDDESVSPVWSAKKSAKHTHMKAQKIIESKRRLLAFAFFCSYTSIVFK